MVSTLTLYGDHGCVEFVKYNPYKHKEFRTTDWYGNKPISPDWRELFILEKDGNVTKLKKGDQLMMMQDYKNGDI